jgi:GTP-binding protein YchF
MKVGIIGLPQTGKKKLFQLLTGMKSSHSGPESIKGTTGVAEIFDPRFDVLAGLYNPRKTVRARINIDLLPKLEASSIREGDVFKDIADVDALCHVVRAFTDDAVYHVSGSVNPERDIDSVNAELILHDLLFIEKRFDRLEKARKKGMEEQARREEALLGRFREHLEKDQPLRLIEIEEEDRRLIASYPFITLKKMIIALNVSETDIANDDAVKRLADRYRGSTIEVMQISAELESEIAALESAEERAEFMREAGIEEPAVNLLSRLCMRSLGLISFFTVGDDEVRQWLIRGGSSAPEAAGAIHTDIQRGFIRAEVMKYPDLSELKSEDAVKKAGRFHVMGREYVVEDGDIISFRFNV